VPTIEDFRSSTVLKQLRLFREDVVAWGSYKNAAPRDYTSDLNFQHISVRVETIIARRKPEATLHSKVVRQHSRLEGPRSFRKTSRCNS